MSRSRGWLAATLLLLAFPLADFIRLPAGEWFRRPETPFDRTNADLHAQWALLLAARDHLPRDASFTVRAPSPDQEMSLFMLSLGLLGWEHARPTSYWGASLPEEGGRTRFVLSLGPPLADERGLRLLQRLDTGCVYEREGIGQ